MTTFGMPRLICGIDPGISGAVAFFQPDEHLMAAYDMPVAGGVVDASELWRLLALHTPEFVMVEYASARPGQGTSSTFKLGQAYGSVLGVLAACALSHRIVTPTAWKRHFSLSSDKEASRRRAIEFFPGPAAEQFSRKKDHGRAEAALLAVYAAETVLRHAAASFAVASPTEAAGVAGAGYARRSLN